MKFVAWLILIFGVNLGAVGQASTIRGKVINKLNLEPLSGVTISTSDAKINVVTDLSGLFTLNTIVPSKLILSHAGFETLTIDVKASTELIFYLTPDPSSLGEVVVTGTMKPVQKMASPVPVEVYSPQFFRKNPTPSIFDGLQMVNGVRPQLNCNICNTGDIHINGLEGPYTMVLIDGMPIVSSLSTVYGLSGIPSSIVDRIEIVKGPASSLYGSEAIGGLINVITKNPQKAPLMSIDLSGTSWQEMNLDASVKFRTGKRGNSLLGINYFNYSNPVDRNNDQFTDMTLQKRISVFNKYSFQRKENRLANFALRYVYEDRWGGDMRWNKSFRGGDSIYGESIYTSRVEIIGNYQLPTQEKLLVSYSFNNHSQRSFYGTTKYDASQQVGFAQLTWDKSLGKQEILAGAVVKYIGYDDNTQATFNSTNLVNQPDKNILPGLFVQDELAINKKQKLLGGLRWDYHPVHGSIFTPRLAWKYSIATNDILRINAGTGFRTVNLFTEDHAALTGARTVVIKNSLKPEQSYNVNVNYIKRLYGENSWLNLDFSAWYTHFTNRILPDYTSNVNQIIYDNLKGYSISKGISLNTEFGFTNSLRGHWGVTLQDVSVIDKSGLSKLNTRQLLTERWSSTWSLTYTIKNWGMSIDYTGNLYGSMLLPILGELDPRSPSSPTYSLHNIQFTKKLSNKWEMYAGIKNLLNWTPAKSTPFLIARSNDPFDKAVQFDSNGRILATPDNPYALSFDPNYVYASNQGIRGYLGIRFQLAY